LWWLKTTKGNIMTTETKSASTRRNARSPKEQVIAFTIYVEAQEILVHYKPYFFSDYGQFEFLSPHKPRRAIPVSETGYRSYFAPRAEIESWPNPEEYARDVATQIARAEREPDAGDSPALPLF
jgi:hypothetical protein